MHNAHRNSDISPFWWYLQIEDIKEVCQMPAIRILPSDSILAKWRVEEELTLKQIQSRLRDTGVEVSIGAIASALSRAGLTNRKRYEEEIPWEPIKVEHNKAYPLFMLRLLGRRRAGHDLSPEDSERLDSWLDRLEGEDAVVLYVYDSPDGFYYVPRLPDDNPDIPVRLQ